MIQSEAYKPFLTISTDESEPKEITSPTNTRCCIDGCYHRITNSVTKLCTEHETFTSLEYIIKHKPIQSPVAVSKYNSEHGGLSCVQMYTDQK